MWNFKKTVRSYIFILFSAFWVTSSFAQTTGLLFGMTYSGGSAGYGTLFSYDPLSNKDSILINFNIANGQDPWGDLIQASNGLLYGMTAYGGNGNGIIFSYNPITGKDSTLLSFKGGQYEAFPLGSLVQASNGFLYGMTQQGGTSGIGVLFMYNIITGKDSVLFSFNGTNGTYPYGSLIQAKDGKLYAMTFNGGTYNYGVLFSYDPTTGKDTVLVNFDLATKGGFPYGSLVQDTNGLLYGMTYSGGSLGTGVLFSYNPLTGKDSVLIDLGATTGFNPRGSLIHDNNGILYGMTSNGGTFNNGVLFSYNPANAKDSILQNFHADSGANPYGTPMLASNGLLYGMTYSGGMHSLGELFSFNLATNYEDTLLAFSTYREASPYGGLIEAMTASNSGLNSISCFGDSSGWAKVSVRGAKMPVTYLWNNGATVDSIYGLKAGTYTCTITDSRGIILIDQFKLSQPPKLLIFPSVSNVCYGDSNGAARISASGGTKPYTYKWNNGVTIDSITGLKPGSKDTCIVTDSNGCSASASFIITQASTPLKIDSITSTPATWPNFNNGTATVWVSGGIPPGDSTSYYYLWTYGIDTLLGPQPNRYSTVIGLTPGIDSVCITSGYYKCGTLCTSVNIPMGIASLIDPENQVKIYPVPSNGKVSIALQGKGYSLLTISDELGRIVYNSPLDANKSNYIMPVDLGIEPNGVYMVQIIGAKGAITHKLVIQK